jgi:PKD repeat protein
VNLPIAFNASASSDPDGTVAFLGWDFGDGDTATGAIASHEYTAKGPFTVTLTVLDNDGTANATTRVVFIGNRPPQIAATNPTSSAVSVSVGASLIMMVVAVDPDGDALTYAWTVDGVATPDANDTIAFSRAQTGPYLVHVTVSDGTDSVSHAWTVEVRPLEPATPFPWWAVALVVLAAVLALAVFLLWRRKRRART